MSGEPVLDRRQRLLSAGLEMLDERILVDASVDDISDRAGVAHGLLFHYFGSKKGFYVEVLRASFGLLVERFNAHRQPEGRKWIEDDLRIVIDSYERHRATIAVAQSVGVSENLDLLVSEVQESTVRRFAERLGIETLDPLAEIGLLGYQNMVLSVIGVWEANGEPDAEALIAYFADLFAATLRTIAAHVPSFRVEASAFDARPDSRVG